MKIELSKTMEVLAEKVIDEHKEEFQELIDGKYYIAYLISDQAKKSNGCIVRGECALVPSKYKWTCNYHFTITFYMPHIKELTQEQLEILMWHELKHAGLDKDKPYIKPHDLIDFKEIVDLYGPYWDLPTGEVNGD